MTVFSLRSPRVGEAEALAELHLLTWEQTYGGLFPPSAWGPDARVQRVRMWTAICEGRPEWRTALAESAGEVVGFAHVGPSVDDPPVRDRHLWFIYLLDVAQGSGAGQALLDEVLRDEPASLWVLEQNPRAIAFYEKNGFVRDGARQPTGFATGGDEIRMLR